MVNCTEYAKITKIKKKKNYFKQFSISNNK